MYTSITIPPKPSLYLCFSLPFLPMKFHICCFIFFLRTPNFCFWTNLRSGACPWIWCTGRGHIIKETDSCFIYYQLSPASQLVVGLLCTIPNFKILSVWSYLSLVHLVPIPVNSYRQLTYLCPENTVSLKLSTAFMSYNLSCPSFKKFSEPGADCYKYVPTVARLSGTFFACWPVKGLCISCFFTAGESSLIRIWMLWSMGELMRFQCFARELFFFKATGGFLMRQWMGPQPHS